MRHRAGFKRKKIGNRKGRGMEETDCA